MAGYSGVLPRAEVEPRVRAAIHHALSLDPNQVEAHTALAGRLAFAQWDWAGGEREYKRALEPHLGRHDEAVAQYRRTLDLEPKFHGARNDLARLYSRMGPHEEAIAEAEKTGFKTGLAEVYARAGRRDDARRVLGEFKALTRDRYVSPLAVASVHAALGEKDQAFDYLDAAGAPDDVEALYVCKRATGLAADPGPVEEVDVAALEDAYAGLGRRARVPACRHAAVLPFNQYRAATVSRNRKWCPPVLIAEG